MADYPNIVFVFADQLRYTALACNGNQIVRTPHIDRLAREGVSFDQAFSSCPICSPYRGQVFTGRYSHANGVMCNEYRMRPGQRTIAHVLRDAGYRTAFVGKLHLGHGPYTEDERLGFDDMIAYNCTHQYYKVSVHHNEDGPYPIREYAPRGETQLALDYIRNHTARSPGQPFCLFMSWGPPHWTTCQGYEREYGVYPREYDVYDPQEMDVSRNVPGPLREYTKRELADYYAMTTSLDDCVGEITRSLDELGIADDTILCFSSDHGDHLNAHGYGKPGYGWEPPYLRGSKATPHDEAIHIPFVMRYPKAVPANRRTDAMLSSVDVMPTLLSLCGVPTPDEVQGRDLSHAALGRAGDGPDSVYLQILGTGWPSRNEWIGLWRGVRTRDYVYARWHDRGGMRVLYDLRADPLEMNNLVDDPACASIVDDMESRLREWIAKTDDPFDTGERLTGTGMLDLGQQLTSARAYASLPTAYREAIEKYRPADLM